MITISREQFKKDDVWRKLWESIKKQHVVPDYEGKELFKNKHIEDYCVQSRHFRVIEGKPDIFIHYDTDAWYNGPTGAAVKITSIGIYDDVNEYMKAYGQGMNSTKDREMNFPEN